MKYIAKHPSEKDILEASLTPSVDCLSHQLMNNMNHPPLGLIDSELHNCLPPSYDICVKYSHGCRPVPL